MIITISSTTLIITYITSFISFITFSATAKTTTIIADTFTTTAKATTISTAYRIIQTKETLQLLLLLLPEYFMLLNRYNEYFLTLGMTGSTLRR